MDDSDCSRSAANEPLKATKWSGPQFRAPETQRNHTGDEETAPKVQIWTFILRMRGIEEKAKKPAYGASYSVESLLFRGVSRGCQYSKQIVHAWIRLEPWNQASALGYYYDAELWIWCFGRSHSNLFPGHAIWVPIDSRTMLALVLWLRTNTRIPLPLTRITR